jgi:hypothetical protein
VSDMVCNMVKVVVRVELSFLLRVYKVLGPPST